jgi:hypothetical protein
MKILFVILISMMGINSYADHTVEAKVNRVFVAPTGFDSNDEVQVTLDGTLSNQCQQVAHTDIRFDKDNNTFYIRQIAKIRATNECHKEDLPRHLGLPGTFTKEISLGVLKAGDYKVSFRGEQGWSSRSFNVAPARVNDTDDEIYAPVSNFFVPEMMEEGQDVEVVLTGVIGSRCLGWKDIAVDRHDDIIVIKPKMEIVSTNFCSVTPWPLEKIVSLGKLKPGRYMVHVRAMNGQGQSRLFTITPNVLDNRGN